MNFTHAIDSGLAFSDPKLQQRYETLISEIRCLVCQNQSIKSSNVFLAVDLRNEVRIMISEGKSNKEIQELHRESMRNKNLVSEQRTKGTRINKSEYRNEQKRILKKYKPSFEDIMSVLQDEYRFTLKDKLQDFINTELK